MHFSNSYLLFTLWSIFISRFQNNKVSASKDEVQTLKHLAQYGYLDISVQEIKSGKRVSREVMSEALREYQNFNHLNVTGNLDKLTVDKMAQPRCGFPDKFSQNLRTKRYTGVKWKDNKVRYYFLYTRNSKNLPFYVGPIEVQKAFRIWERYIPLKIEESDNEDTADFVVSFETGDHGDEPPFDGPGGILGHADMEAPGIIHFDDDEDWHFAEKERNILQKLLGLNLSPNLFKVAVHEVGHTLGLDHSSDEESIMHPINNIIYEPDFTLSKGDISLIQSLYYPKKK